MSLAATVKAMAAAGMSAEQIADVVDRMEEARLAKSRAGNAKRQAAYRARHNGNNADNGVTPVIGVTAVTEKEDPHTPKENSPPLPSAPKGASVRPPAGGLDDPKTILAEVLPAETAAEVVAHRKALKSPLTAGSARGLAKNFAAYGDPTAAAQAMMAGGWRGFKPEWMASAPARAGPGQRDRTVSDLAAMNLDEPDFLYDPRPDPRNGAPEGASPADEARSGFAGRLSEPASRAARRGALIDH